jgi:3',5'-cyclic AMP phosphodiesterase CpdA
MRLRWEWPAAALLCATIFGISQQAPFYFAMLSDTQFGMYAADKSFAQETANYEFAVAAVNRLKPGFVIVLGDLVNRPGDPAQVAEFLRISRRIDKEIPVYFVPGNHDTGNEPTPESLAAYRRNFGRDYYGFRAGPVYGIVLNTALIQAPGRVMREYEAQDLWLKKELESAKRAAAPQIVVFGHHPLFLAEPEEPDRYENLPREKRRALIELLHRYHIRHYFAGHTHKNVLARDGDLEVVATAPVGKPLGKDGSGIRIAAVTANGLEHQYFEFGALPDVLRLRK